MCIRACICDARVKTSGLSLGVTHTHTTLNAQVRGEHVINLKASQELNILHAFYACH